MTNYVVAARLRHVVLERDKKSDGIQVERLFSDTGCFFAKDHNQNIPCSIRTDDGWRYTEYIYMKVTFLVWRFISLLCYRLAMSLAYACILWNLRVKDVKNGFFPLQTDNYCSQANLKELAAEMVDKDDKVNDKYKKFIEDTRKYSDDMEEYDEDTKKYIEDKEEQNEDMENKDEESYPIDQEPDWERPADHPELYDLNR